MAYYFFESGWGPDPIPMKLFWMSIGSILIVTATLILLLRAPATNFHQHFLPETQRRALLFFIWWMSALAIAKEGLVFGPSRWEGAYTFFIVDCVILSTLLWKLKT